MGDGITRVHGTNFLTRYRIPRSPDCERSLSLPAANRRPPWGITFIDFLSVGITFLLWGEIGSGARTVFERLKVEVVFMSPEVKVIDSGLVGGWPSRVVSAGGFSWVESWGTDSWLRDDTLSIPDVAFATPISPAVVSAMGLSPEDVTPVSD